ncbi:glycoside hydrolase 15-related protein [Vulcanisaeta moutnovskia 768-28]|uniref:Glycoside hydrolase 15-related protein n=1 Tax=Vulcanisaeta moutnovskia (strain 768-28) TaxID=985053 RepID=F0QXZ4_VULM7|nr:glycoside hydrolase family 15 protein [Vulcanisaeta moutnovskia]ADY02480.1 glycoside hydrolase 15-related protein [Vulcanisaeta moutnovskia 768-28]
MIRKTIFLIIGAVLLIIGISIIILSLTQEQSTVQMPINTSSPAYLLLSNWRNLSIYISTEYPIPSPVLNGESSRPPSILQIFYGQYGLLSMNVTIMGLGNTSKAYLELNNTVIIKGSNGEVSIFIPPNYTTVVMISKSNASLTINVFMPRTYNYQVINSTYLVIKSPLQLSIYSNRGIDIESVSGWTILSIHGNYTYVALNLGSTSTMPISELMSINNNEVSNWLGLARRPRLSGALLTEYYLSLLLIMDDQNPVTGEFIASPEPVYFYTWVRDSSFAAMALQTAGYYGPAMKYWLWMCSAQNVSGTWYTRYNFWTGAPDETFGIPEYDSIGLFQIGVWQYYEYTHNKTFLMEVMPCINKSLNWELEGINENNGLIPQDLSIWESNYAYNFWTQAIDDLGLYAAAQVYRALGLNNTEILRIANELNATIQKYFYSKNFYSQALTKTVIYTGSGSQVTYAPNGIPDSSVILPIAMGLINPRSARAVSTVNTVIRVLMVNGGLARFPGDDYHYGSSLYDSTAPDPPWLITTLFLAMYYEEVGNHTGALNILTWCVRHSQYGLLPEAIDPRLGYPLPTTSPLTWSAAMYVITALNYKPPQKPTVAVLVLVAIVVVILAIVMFIVYGRTSPRQA